jgi:2-dehydropantoate 2-reductase
MDKILVFGAGTIGTFLGANLYAAGNDITLYGRRKLTQIYDRIFINGIPFKVPPRIYNLEASHYDIIFVTTKLYDSQAAIREIQSNHLNPQIIVFIQNGLVEEDFYGDLAKHPSFLTISVFEGYRLIADQLLTTRTDLGWQTENNCTGLKICKLLQSANINCTVTSQLPQLRAEKLMWNVSLNALSAMEKKTFAELMADKNLSLVVDGLFQESYEVLKSDYNLPSLDFLKQRFEQQFKTVKTHYSSTYQDVVSGRKTEIDFLNGLILKIGRNKGIPTPINQEIYCKFCQQISECGFQEVCKPLALV